MLVDPALAHQDAPWNSFDIIYTSLVWASLGLHIYSLVHYAHPPKDGMIRIARECEIALNVSGWAIIFMVIRFLSYVERGRGKS